MLTLNCYLKQYGIVPHPEFKDRYTIIDRPGSVSSHKKSSARLFLKNGSIQVKDLPTIYSVYKHRRFFDSAGHERVSLPGSYFKERYPDHFHKIFKEGVHGIAMHLESAVSISEFIKTEGFKDRNDIPEEMKHDLEMYSGYVYSPYVPIIAEPIVGVHKVLGE